MADTITLDRLRENLAFFNKMYDAVRLVDPVGKRVLEYCGQGMDQTDEVCYAYWQSGKICDNCISVRAHQSEKCYFKLEHSPDVIMMVTALPVETIEKPTVLELLKNATESMMIGTGDYAGGRPIRVLVMEINDLIMRDDLTGLYNRRYIDERLPVDIVKATIDQAPLSVLFMDVDNLKDINDTYGHVFGDKLLKEIAEVALQCIRANVDWVARYAGDEFLICLNGAAGQTAHRIAERIRCRVEELCLPPAHGEILATVSFGIYTTQGASLTAEELISLADQRMYEAKRRGKNRTAADQ